MDKAEYILNVFGNMMAFSFPLIIMIIIYFNFKQTKEKEENVFLKVMTLYIVAFISLIFCINILIKLITLI